MEGLSRRFVDFPQTREEFVASRLREAILRGDLAPGERLDENALAKSLGVSRTPIRSALRVLAAESLVELHPHRGAVVNELSPNELEEVYLIRVLLEGMAARLAAPRMDDERIAALEAILEELEATVDANRWLVLNSHFHSAIYQAANRPRLLSIIDYVRNIATPYILQFIELPGNMDSSREDHRRILAACKKRDGELAELEVRKHLEEVATANVEFVESVESADNAS